MSRTFNTDPHYVKLLRAAKAGYNSRKKMHNLYPINTSTTPSWTITSYEPLLVVNISQTTKVIPQMTELVATTRKMTDTMRIIITLRIDDPDGFAWWDQTIDDSEDFDPVLHEYFAQMLHEYQIRRAKNRDKNIAKLYQKFNEIIEESPIIQPITIYRYYKRKFNAFHVDIERYDQFDDETLAKLAVNTIANAIRDVNHGIHPNATKLSNIFEVYLQIPNDCYEPSQISDLPFDKNCVAIKRHKFKPGYPRQTIIDTRNGLGVPVEINIPYKETSSQLLGPEGPSLLLLDLAGCEG